MKIVVGYDESKVAKEALRTAIEMARIHKGKLELVHSLIERTDTDYDVIQRVQEDLDKAKEEAEKAGVECGVHLLNRDMAPGEDIVQFSEEQQADMIVIGIKKRSRLEKMVFASTARYVILKASCPVLSVK